MDHARTETGAVSASETDVTRHDVEAVSKGERRELYKSREPIFPKRMDGTFRRIKWAAMAVLLGIYYLTPWIRWDRGPNAPDQAVLLDLPARRFYFFWIEIWPQEVIYLTGILILAALGLFLATSLAGRLWCGYACPQTVWTDLFIMVERFFEGRRNARIKLHKAPWTANKIVRKTAKHITWLVIAMATGGAWVFYFADAPTLAHDLVNLDAPPVAYITIGILTFTTYLLGGFAREQVCIYMCPWPRIQGAMVDEDTLVITYRRNRGEPRGPHKKGASWEGRGDCVSCRQCVVVCPMGIDIRDGLQLECIQCGLCIDACNDIMDKVGRPRGLIAYDTDANVERRLRGEAPRYRLMRPRTVIYATLFVAVGALMLWSLATRSPLDVNIIRDRNPLYVTLSDGRIRNGYTVKILNKAHQSNDFTISLSGLPGADLKIVGLEPGEPVTVPADSLRAVQLYVTAPRHGLAGSSTPVSFAVTNLETGLSYREDTSFKGPAR
ncbi:MAG: cytochrome c oxidase accessory protein CcoG [Alphaproteobacteria bacterium]|nr:MAG: cytochrome c oxidase accessory protein CcoG [Alphaproteobacteria bacterium]